MDLTSHKAGNGVSFL